MGCNIQALNEYLYSYRNSLPEAEKNKLHIANSIWFSDQKEFTANKDFLQTNADYYGADIFKAPFNASTLTDINEWVKDKTDSAI